MAVRPPPAALAARFRIEGPFTEGATGTLYYATDNTTGKNGLLKVVYAASQITPSERARLVRELEKLASLGHPGLATPFATGLDGETPWLFRENIGGESLAARIARGALAQPDALAIAAQLAAALDELHRAGLLQRDLSPSHVILREGTSPPRAALIDSGIAARIAAGALFEVTGKPAYVSPEHAAGKLVSFRSDLYSLGCVLFEMLTGRPPFAGATEAVLEAQRSTAPPALDVAVPSSVSSLLQQLLSKDPRERPFSAQQVRRALEPYLPAGAAPPAAAGGGPKRTLLGVPSPVGQKRADQTEELSAMDLSRAEAALRPAPPRADATMPLSPMDLARAEQILGKPPPPRFDATMPLGAQELGAAVPPPPAGRRSAPPPPPGARAGASSAGLSVPMAPKVPTMPPPPPAAAMAAAAPAQSGGGDLDYDDLAETIARDHSPDEATAPTMAMPATAPTQQGYPAPAGGGFAPAAQAGSGFAPASGGFASAGGGFAPAAQSAGGFAPAAQSAGGFAPAAQSAGSGFATAGGGFGPAMPATMSSPMAPPPTAAMPMAAPIPAAPMPARAIEEPDTLPVRRIPPAVLWLGGVVAFCVVAGGSGAGVSYMLHQDILGTGEAPPIATPPAVGGVMPTVPPVAHNPVFRPPVAPMPPTMPPVAPMPPTMPPVAPMPPTMPPIAPLPPIAPMPPIAPLPEPAPAVEPTPAPAPATTGSDSASGGSSGSSGGSRPSGSSGGSSGTAAGSSGSSGGSSGLASRVGGSSGSGGSSSSSGGSSSGGGSSSSGSSGGRLSSRIGGGSSGSGGSSGGTAATGSSGGTAATGSSGGSSGSSFDDLRTRAREAFSARRFDEAAEAYEAAARLQPRNAAVWAGLGAARLAGGNAAAAVTAYEHAVEINPGSAAFHAALGRACASAGDRSRARREYEEALRIDPDNRDATIGLTRL